MQAARNDEKKNFISRGLQSSKYGKSVYGSCVGHIRVHGHIKSASKIVVFPKVVLHNVFTPSRNAVNFCNHGSNTKLINT